MTRAWNRGTICNNLHNSPTCGCPTHETVANVVLVQDLVQRTKKNRKKRQKRQKLDRSLGDYATKGGKKAHTPLKTQDNEPTMYISDKISKIRKRNQRARRQSMKKVKATKKVAFVESSDTSDNDSENSWTSENYNPKGICFESCDEDKYDIEPIEVFDRQSLIDDKRLISYIPHPELTKNWPDNHDDIGCKPADNHDGNECNSAGPPGSIRGSCPDTEDMAAGQHFKYNTQMGHSPSRNSGLTPRKE